MTARPATDLAAPQRATATPLQQHQGAWHIAGRRCEPAPMRLPSTDTERAWNMLQADLDAQHERTVRNWLIVDAIAAVTLVGVLAALFAGWL